VVPPTMSVSGRTDGLAARTGVLLHWRGEWGGVVANTSVSGGGVPPLQHRRMSADTVVAPNRHTRRTHLPPRGQGAAPPFQTVGVVAVAAAMVEAVAVVMVVMAPESQSDDDGAAEQPLPRCMSGSCQCWCCPTSEKKTQVRWWRGDLGVVAHTSSQGVGDGWMGSNMEGSGVRIHDLSPP